jgi:rfaE bifunctional protein nucleotidyltransferase chain/domain
MNKVFINGTFDILHPAHVDMLNYAKTLGDFLCVAVDTDDRVKELKGSERPINTLSDRMKMLSSIRHVDWVTSFASESELVDIIKYLRPQYMVVGSDYRHKTVIGSEYAGQLIFYERNEQYSSTKIIQRIANR